MASIAENLAFVHKELGENVGLVAVSKYNPIESIQSAYDFGQRIFGESHVQELTRKYESLPKDIEWHFIGHLQTNKVKYIAPYISLIHAVDSFRLLEEIDKQGQKCGRRISCLLQLHVAKEDTKYGFSLPECRQMLKETEWKKLVHVHIKGIMCMASNVDDITQVEGDFKEAFEFFIEVQKEFFNSDTEFCIRSWGMSHDYKMAIHQGSTLVRIGSKIFGER